jgi:preprotein translocase subunit Sss1
MHFYGCKGGVKIVSYHKIFYFTLKTWCEDLQPIKQRKQVLDKYLKTDAEPNEINCHLKSLYRIIKLLTKPNGKETKYCDLTTLYK